MSQRIITRQANAYSELRNKAVKDNNFDQEQYYGGCINACSVLMKQLYNKELTLTVKPIFNH